MPTITNPRVTSVSPSDNSTSVSLSSVIKVTFTNMMSDATLTDAYIYLRLHGETVSKIPSTISLAFADNKTIEITPTTALNHNREYDIVVVGRDIGDPIQDILGMPLLVTYISSFTTAEELETEFEPDPESPLDDDDDTLNKPYVISVYPRHNQYNITPLKIKVKIADPDELLNDIISVGVDDSAGDFNLIKGELSANDLEDIDIIPVEYMNGDIELINNIINFTPDIPFEDETIYTILLTGQFQNSITKFYSEFTHFYGDIELIKSDLSKHIKITDWIIAKHVANVSEYAYEIANTTYGTDIDWDSRPFYIDEYVRYKVESEFVRTKYIELTTGSSQVTLGDFAIQNTTNAFSLSLFLKTLDLNLKKWEDMLHGHLNRGYAKPVGVSKKAEEDSGSGYPEYIDRRFKDKDGTKVD